MSIDATSDQYLACPQYSLTVAMLQGGRCEDGPGILANIIRHTGLVVASYYIYGVVTYDS